jgi:hypothetical protein
MVCSALKECKKETVIVIMKHKKNKRFGIATG